ncbi:MAG: hypothetical protein CL565_05480 [Alphaproteobacteria bacterium]|nr:hypothetical protein [Alphaproteobacteria bacterium]
MISGLIISLLYSFASSTAERASENTAPDKFEMVKAGIPVENLQAGYQKITGAWRTKQGDTEMLLQLYSNGYFRWRVNDNNAPDYVLLAQGRYIVTGERVLFKEDRALPFKRGTDNRFTKFRHLNVGSASLPWALEDTTLKLSMSGNTDLAPNFQGLLSEMSGQDKVLLLDYLGAP